MTIDKKNLEIWKNLTKQLHQKGCREFWVTFYRRGGKGETLTRRNKSFRYPDSIDDLFSEMQEGEELSLMSFCFDDWRAKRQIPMIDFKTKDRSIAERVCNEIQFHLKMDYWLFETKNSFHAYFIGHLPLDEWCSYMGKLILKGDAVDQRWIGHSLNRCWSGLRWSAGNNMEPPKFITKKQTGKHNDQS